MQKDYIYYLAWFAFIVSILGLFLGDIKSKRENRIISILFVSIPIYGRFFGWW